MVEKLKSLVYNVAIHKSWATEGALWSCSLNEGTHSRLGLNKRGISSMGVCVCVCLDRLNLQY